jgi:hypothetical protein
MFARDLPELRRKWRKTIEGKGGRCPCCDRWGKVNARAINSTMARSLLWIYAAGARVGDPLAWTDVPGTAPRWLVQTNQIASLRWWGFVERMPNDNPKVKCNGMWRLTRDGMAFALGGITAREKVYVYDAEPVGFGGGQIGIRDALGKAFDYEDMMRERFDWRDAE